MRAKLFAALFTAGILLCVTGCNTDDFASLFPWGDDINFSTELTSPSTRAVPYEESGANAYSSMGVYAVTSTPTLIMDNQHLTRTSGSNGWSYTPTVQWPDNSKSVSFYAYSPYTDQSSESPNPKITKDPSTKIPQITYSVSDIIAEQTDLLMAVAQINKRDSSTTDVLLPMRHALTRIVFSARLQHAPLTTISDIKITEIELSGLHNSGSKTTLDAAEPWSSLSGSANYILSNTADGGLKDIPLKHTELQNLTTNIGSLYLMPQSTPTDAKLKITYTISYNNSTTDPDITTQTLDLPDILDELTKGEALRFLITVPNTAKPEPFLVEVIHTDWSDQEVEVDIDKDPYLYISNETVYAYDGAVTCIYFESNIAPTGTDGNFNDDVYIEDMCYVGSNVGSRQAVKDDFYAIAKNDPIRNHITINPPIQHINNLRYEKISANIYRGHLDIVQTNTSEAGETANQGKHLLILKLHVGKIVRDISVQRVVTPEAAKQNPTRYVGTFHRHNETGERLVTWHENTTTTWRVEKDLLAGTNYDDLILDTRISPDFRNKQLYSLIARDPEGTRVEQNDNLFGQGRVYFRVGWKDPITKDEKGKFTNRYARIKVKIWRDSKNEKNAPNNPDETYYLYCRQGETPERVASAPSEYALYNVALPGEFTRYPSQVGMLYQWNRLSYWSPLGIAMPYGWDAITYETEFSYERSACPDGYVYPSTIQVGEMNVVFGNNWNIWGYLADGYYDRRAITYDKNYITLPNPDTHRVNASQSEVGSSVLLFYNPANARSIYLPTGSSRNSAGQLVPYSEVLGKGFRPIGGYWTDQTAPGTIISSTSNNPKQAFGMHLQDGAGASSLEWSEKTHAHSLRCVRANGWVVTFDVNGGENGPKNITVPAVTAPANPNSTLAKIPEKKPDNYYRTGYRFKGWIKKDKPQILYVPGQEINMTDEFGAANLPATETKLYAQWEQYTIDNIIDFSKFVPVSGMDYLLTKPSIRYEVMTTTAGNNGSTYAIAHNTVDLQAYFTGDDSKVYPNLEFSSLQPSTSWETAYNACKNYNTPSGSIGNWRLPRVQELALLDLYESITDVNKEQVEYVLGAKTSTSHSFWTGTESTSGALYNHRTYTTFISADPKNASKPYRCVRMKIQDAHYDATTIAGLKLKLETNSPAPTNGSEYFINTMGSSPTSTGLSVINAKLPATGNKLYVRFDSEITPTNAKGSWSIHSNNKTIAVFTKYDAFDFAELKSLLEPSSALTSGKSFSIGMEGNASGIYDGLAGTSPNLSVGGVVHVKFTSSLTGTTLPNGWAIKSGDNTSATYTKVQKYDLETVKGKLEGSVQASGATYYVDDLGGNKNLDQILPNLAAGHNVKIIFNTPLTAVSPASGSAWTFSGNTATFNMPTMETSVDSFNSAVLAATNGTVIYYDNPNSVVLTAIYPYFVLNKKVYVVLKSPLATTTNPGRWTQNGRILMFDCQYDSPGSGYKQVGSLLEGVTSDQNGRTYYIYDSVTTPSSYPMNSIDPGRGEVPNLTQNQVIYLWFPGSTIPTGNSNWIQDLARDPSGRTMKYTKP